MAREMVDSLDIACSLSYKEQNKLALNMFLIASKDFKERARKLVVSVDD